MRVIAKRIQDKNQVFLTEGFEYVVYGILILSDETNFCVIDDTEDWPQWYPSTYFACIDPKIPADWLFLFFDDKQYKSGDRFKFVVGPNFVASSVEAYDGFVLNEESPCKFSWQYVESQVEVSFIDDATALYVYDKRKMKIRMEKLLEGVILNSDTIESWLPPYQNEIVSDLEKERIQRLTSNYLDKHNIIYGWT